MTEKRRLLVCLTLAVLAATIIGGPFVVLPETRWEWLISGPPPLAPITAITVISLMVGGVAYRLWITRPTK